MTGFKEGKKILIILICFFCILLSGVTGIAITQNLNKKNNTPPQAGAGARFIYTVEDFKEVAEEVKASKATTDSSGNTVYVYDVWDTTNFVIYLCADLDFEGEQLTPIGHRLIGDGGYDNLDFMFNGKFYGQGHTISNFTLYGYSTADGDSFGIFALLGPDAVVTGLKVKNVKGHTNNFIEDSWGDNVYFTETDCSFGGIAGRVCPGATITDCMVENFEVLVYDFFEEQYNTLARVGGIVGEMWLPVMEGMYDRPDIIDYNWEEKTLTITDCIVKDLKITHMGGDKLWYPAYILSDDGYLSSGLYSAKIERCIGRGYENNSSSDGPVEIVNASSLLSNVEVNYCYTTSSEYSSTYQTFDFEKMWYHSEDYDNGWPMLKTFLPKYKFIFGVDSSCFSVGIAIAYDFNTGDQIWDSDKPGTLEVLVTKLEYPNPEDAVDVTQAELRFGNIVIRAEPIEEDNGYEFDRWEMEEWDEDVYYWNAFFREERLSLTFKKTTYVSEFGINFAQSGDTLVVDNVVNNTTITVNYVENLEAQTVHYYFSFTDANQNFIKVYYKLHIKYQYNGETSFVTEGEDEICPEFQPYIHILSFDKAINESISDMTLDVGPYLNGTTTSVEDKYNVYNGTKIYVVEDKYKITYTFTAVNGTTYEIIYEDTTQNYLVSLDGLWGNEYVRKDLTVEPYFKKEQVKLRVFDSFGDYETYPSNSCQWYYNTYYNGTECYEYQVSPLVGDITYEFVEMSGKRYLTYHYTLNELTYDENGESYYANVAHTTSYLVPSDEYVVNNNNGVYYIQDGYDVYVHIQPELVKASYIVEFRSTDNAALGTDNENIIITGVKPTATLTFSVEINNGVYKLTFVVIYKNEILATVVYTSNHQKYELKNTGVPNNNYLINQNCSITPSFGLKEYNIEYE